MCLTFFFLYSESNGVSLIKKQKKRQIQRDTEGKPCEDKDRDESDASIRQGTPRITEPT